jgi:hypothetical protein
LKATAGLLTAGGALALAGLTLVGPAPTRAPITPVLTAKTSGNLRIGATHDGRPLIRAERMIPGGRRGGNVRVRNRGARAVRLALVRRRIAQGAGPAGGLLSRVLRIKVKRYVRRGGRLRKKTVFQRRVSRMPRRALGRLEPGSSRRFRVSLRLPDGGMPPGPGEGDNAFQGSQLGVDLVWLAEPARGP